MATCDQTVNCPCDGLPITGFDSAAPDPADFPATGYAAVVPPLGFSNWVRLECMMFYDGTVSQTDSQFNADSQALLCALNQISPYGPETTPGGGGGPSPLIFFSTAQSCTVNCPDGLPFVFEVPAGAFFGTTQMAANVAAQTYACAQANVRAVCLSALSMPNAVMDGPYSASITATGGSLAGPGQTNLWQLTAGALPTGLTFNGGNLASNQVTITGTPTQTGTFTFTVSCVDPLGDTMFKNYVLNVASVTVTDPGRGGVAGYGTNTVKGCTLTAPGVFHAYTPSAPFTDGREILNQGNTSTAWQTSIQFASTTPVVWHYHWWGDGSFPHANDPSNNDNNVYIPGTVCGNLANGLNPVVAPDTTWDITGTFSTDNGSPMLVWINWNSQQVGNAHFEWYPATS